jgi:hypothetical protein
MPKVTPACHLATSEGEKPKSALYTCSCGEACEGLKAWREHMVQRSQLRKRALAFLPNLSPARTHTS